MGSVRRVSYIGEEREVLAERKRQYVKERKKMILVRESGRGVGKERERDTGKQREHDHCDAAQVSAVHGKVPRWA